jgi:hypothetical protein
VKDDFEERLQSVQAFLERADFNGITRPNLLLPAWHSIVTFSNSAEAITNLYVQGQLAAKDLIDILNKMVTRTVHPRVNPYRHLLDRVTELSR